VGGSFVEIVSGVFKIKESDFNLELTMDSVPNWDSLKHMELITQLEESYKIIFELDDIVEMRSVASIVEKLQKKGVSVE